jgi:hypothetical protein
MKKLKILLVIIAGLPILFHVFNPSAELGGIGLFLGFWGMFISPVVIFGFLLYLLLKKGD